jgi:hypothetical protein
MVEQFQLQSPGPDAHVSNEFVQFVNKTSGETRKESRIMKKGTFLKLSLGVAAAAAMTLSMTSRASADLLSSITFTEPAETLVMPFDLSTGKASFQIVSRIGGGDPVIATHWSYWSKDCRHLADVLICLTRDDTVVVDPSSLQGEIQNNLQNIKTGPVINLTGELGLVTVTAFTASTATSEGRECVIDDVTAVVPDQLVGSWTIANTATKAAFGHDAIGMTSANFPDAATFFGDSSTRLPFFLQTFNPTTLTDSEVIFLTVEFGDFSGNGRFQGSEIGPITFSGSPKVCCDATFIDNLEVQVSLPDVCFDCVGFAPISDNVAPTGETSLIPPTTAVNSSGLLQLTNCTVADPEGSTDRTSIGESSQTQFIFAFHGQAVGPFGTIANGKYTGGLETNS